MLGAAGAEVSWARHAPGFARFINFWRGFNPGAGRTAVQERDERSMGR